MNSFSSLPPVYELFFFEQTNKPGTGSIFGNIRLAIVAVP